MRSSASRFGTFALAVVASLWIAQASAQERFSLFVGSDPLNVARMIKIANLKDHDVAIDLGAGDGRIVFAAAQANPTVRGIGVDIDATLVGEANAAAAKNGMAERVQFFHRNVFDTDLSNVDVVFMWLFPELMRLLRPKILDEARPGTRVIAALWDFGSWPPDLVDKDPIDINMWIVPAKVGGHWNWELPVAALRQNYSAMFEQRFQNLEGIVRVGKRHGIFHDLKLRGEEIAFTLMMTLQDVGFTRHEFTGRVRGDSMQGIVRITLPPKTNEEEEELESVVLPWQATRSTKTSFFEPVGVELR